MFYLLTLTARCVSLAFMLCGVTLFSVAACAGEKINQTRQHELVQLVHNDCGSCHGLTLKGGLGSALLPESLRDKAPEGLRETILRGRTGTAMPPWSAFVSEEEANWIVEQLMKGFPDVH